MRNSQFQPKSRRRRTGQKVATRRPSGPPVRKRAWSRAGPGSEGRATRQVPADGGPTEPHTPGHPPPREPSAGRTVHPRACSRRWPVHVVLPGCRRGRSARHPHRTTTRRQRQRGRQSNRDSKQKLTREVHGDQPTPTATPAQRKRSHPALPCVHRMWGRRHCKVRHIVTPPFRTQPIRGVCTKLKLTSRFRVGWRPMGDQKRRECS